MTFWEIYLTGYLTFLAAGAALWLISLRLKNSSIVDLFWGLFFVLAVWQFFALTDGAPARKLLIAALVTVWGVRLSGHLLLRNWGQGEDFRYAQWRRETGPSYWWKSYFRVFFLQGTIAWLLSAPLLIAQFQADPAALTVFDIAGAVVWGIGFFFEAVSDWQLRRFKADPANKGKLLTTGLWRYSRHPNYFGDAAQWWGFFLVAVSGPWGVLTVYAPLLMTLLLMRVSGVTLLERTLQARPGYEDYMARTSAFFPLPPHHKA